MLRKQKINETWKPLPQIRRTDGTVSVQPGKSRNVIYDVCRIPGPLQSLLGRQTTTVAGPGGRRYLLLVEHPAVYTLGKKRPRVEPAGRRRFPAKRIGATYYHIDRGGDITYHGPGQIVGYPILDLERHRHELAARLHSTLEGAVIRTVAVTASGRTHRRRRASGSKERSRRDKICAIGVRASRYVTMHGFALNVKTDLRYFSPISDSVDGFTDRKGVPRRSKRSKSVARFRWRRSNDASSKIYARI